MKKFNFLFILFLLLGTLESFADELDISEEQSKNGIDLLVSSYDWDVFWREVGFFGDAPLVLCDTSDPSKSAFVFPMTLIEPLYLMESTIHANKINILGANIGRFAPETAGTNTEGGGTYVNVVKLPIMHLLLASSSINGLFTFEEGAPMLTYIGLLDPKKWWDVLAIAMAPERYIFATVPGALAGLASCAAVTALDVLPASVVRNSAAGESLRGIIDSLYFSAGCNGAMPVGTISAHDSPIINAIIVGLSVMSDVHSHKGVAVDVFAAHTVLSTLNGYDEKIICKPVNNPALPITMYTLQVLSPIASKNHELGVNATNYAFKNPTGKADVLTMMVLSKRRDYGARF